ncbi:hypothetical protein [Pseudomonas putida]|uniref:Uncharacterized protein n=1 Tax=Pseudomonas putida TaxID=303 RepID=A0A1B2F135_PSEPU|nr:hypothetical protein [Pseudomonas putida]ANY85951.1 hypothetical protein IEC33019_0347 [Pseudomonas putida]
MQTPEKITLVLRPVDGGSLAPILPFLKLGDEFQAEGFTAVIAGVSAGDMLAYLEQKAFDMGMEREEHGHAMEYCERALGMHPLLVAHAREMYDLLRLINVKVGGLRAVCDHGGDPSEEMWEQFDEALDAIWPLMEALAPAVAVREQPVAMFNIDEHVQMAADARRYRYLRDRERLNDPDHDLLVVRGNKWFCDEELDREVDTALRLEALEQQVVQEQQP